MARRATLLTRSTTGRGGDPTPDLVERVRALTEAAEHCEGRVPPEPVAQAHRVIAQADRRLAISGDATVVALAGATGSGKSSTFNALTGTEVAAVGVRRPTTSAALACTWGTSSAEELLEWLEIPRRHAVEADPARAEALAGLVLIDLPDHDSTEISHRMEVDRLVQLVDVLVWVVDPQKYADAALHDRYLKPLAGHAEVMLVVLNQIDRLDPEERASCRQDLRRLLDSEGLGQVEVAAVSASTGEGIAELRQRLAAQVAEKKAAARRLAADVSGAADDLAAVSGTAALAPLSRSRVEEVNTTLAAAAGVPTVVQAVGQAWRQRGGLATGWPVLAWLARFRPDPLRRLHLDRLAPAKAKRALEPGPAGRSSLPATTSVQQARVNQAVRLVSDDAAHGLSRGWAGAMRVAARSHSEQIPDALDRAVASADLDLDRHRRWWQVVRALQWLLVAVVVGGFLWLGASFVLAYLQLPPLPRVTWRGFPAPTVLVVGGVLAGLGLAGLSRVGVGVGARRRAASAHRRLHRAVSAVTDELVVAPLATEGARYEAARGALQRARG